MKTLFKTILHGTEGEAQEYVETFRKEFSSLPAHEVAFPRSVSDVGKYSDPLRIYGKGSPIQSRGALLYNHYLKKNGLDKQFEQIQNGDKLRYVYLRLPNPIRENTIAFPDRLPKGLDLDGYIDYDLQFEKSYAKPLGPIFKAMGWSIEPVASLW